jgi:hypothetical protein
MFEVWFTSSSGGVPLTRKSVIETSRLDDGSKNKRASINLYARFTGKKAPVNALKTWMDFQSHIAEEIAKVGYPTDKPAIRRVCREDIDDLIVRFDGYKNQLNTLRDDFIVAVPHMRQQILDSYSSDDCYEEVRDLLDRWHPNKDRMNPIFGVSDLLKGTGLQTSEEVEAACLEAELSTKLHIVKGLEGELESLFERLDSPDRIRGQLRDLEGLLSKLAPLIKAFSDDTELVSKLEDGLDILKQIPQSKEGILASQDLVQQGLDLFSTTPEAEVTEPEPEAEVTEPEPEPEPTPEPTPEVDLSEPDVQSFDWISDELKQSLVDDEADTEPEVQLSFDAEPTPEPEVQLSFDAEPTPEPETIDWLEEAEDDENIF